MLKHEWFWRQNRGLGASENRYANYLHARTSAECKCKIDVLNTQNARKIRIWNLNPLTGQ